MTKQLAPPQSWDEFEQLCHGLWTELLSDPETKMHGRRGQTQNGVDVFGCDYRSGNNALVGIQCKGKDNFLKKNVTEAELREEVRKATSFKPELNKFILATTGLRDVNIQSFTRTINSESLTSGKFTISTWSWQDISDEIQNYPALLRKYYPEMFIQPNLTRTKNSLDLRLPLSGDHEQKIAALFEIDDVKSELQSDFRHELRDFALEVASNSFRHGQAKRLEVEISSNKVVIKDNGVAYNPLVPTTSEFASVGMQGLKYINYFINQYKVQLSASYIYDLDTSLNIITLSFKMPIVRIKTDDCLIDFSDYAFIGRGEAIAAGAAQQFPEECEVYTMHLDRQTFMMSSLYMYLEKVVSRLPFGKRLRIVLSNQAHEELVNKWFDPSVVEVICH